MTIPWRKIGTWLWRQAVEKVVLKLLKKKTPEAADE